MEARNGVFRTITKFLDYLSDAGASISCKKNRNIEFNHFLIVLQHSYCNFNHIFQLLVVMLWVSNQTALTHCFSLNLLCFKGK